MNWKRLVVLVCGLMTLVTLSCRRQPEIATTSLPEQMPGLSYTNYRIAKGPWSVHLVRVDRSRPEYRIVSSHALGGAIGLSTLSQQIAALKPETGIPVAGVNGDFYQREKAYAGDPRGLQIVDGELISGPIGGVSFWIDAQGQPYTTNVTSQFRITWSNGARTVFGLNEERLTNHVVLFTPAVGVSTHTVQAKELILEPLPGAGGDVPSAASEKADQSWLPLRVGETFKARVKEIREQGNTPFEPGTMVLALPPAGLPGLPALAPGLEITISTETTPDLRGAKMAISGGPVLMREGKLLALKRPKKGGALPYEFSSMWERHPRSVLGWNDRFFFLAQIDGRQKKLSVGMTLEELAQFMARFGCHDAMNLDGGGSATFWYDGQVRNSPCDRIERPIANALILLKSSPTMPVTTQVLETSSK